MRLGRISETETAEGEELREQGAGDAGVRKELNGDVLSPQHQTCTVAACCS